MNKSRGFTLIELMVTVAILAILLAIAAPSFSEFTAGTQVTTTANEFKSDLFYAQRLSRGAAIDGVPGTINLVQLFEEPGGWQNGWTIRVTTGAGTQVIKTHPALAADTQVVALGASPFNFGPIGYPAAGACPGVAPACTSWTFRSVKYPTRTATVAINVAGAVEIQ